MLDIITKKFPKFREIRERKDDKGASFYPQPTIQIFLEGYHIGKQKERWSQRDDHEISEDHHRVIDLSNFLEKQGEVFIDLSYHLTGGTCEVSSTGDCLLFLNTLMSRIITIQNDALLSFRINFDIFIDLALFRINSLDKEGRFDIISDRECRTLVINQLEDTIKEIKYEASEWRKAFD